MLFNLAFSCSHNTLITSNSSSFRFSTAFPIYLQMLSSSHCCFSWLTLDSLYCFLRSSMFFSNRPSVLYICCLTFCLSFCIIYLCWWAQSICLSRSSCSVSRCLHNLSKYILLTKATFRSLSAMKYFNCWLVTSSSIFFCFWVKIFKKYSSTLFFYILSLR